MNISQAEISRDIEKYEKGKCLRMSCEREMSVWSMETSANLSRQCFYSAAMMNSKLDNFS